jgi:hypothetical protein
VSPITGSEVLIRPLPDTLMTGRKVSSSLYGSEEEPVVEARYGSRRTRTDPRCPERRLLAKWPCLPWW